MKKGIRVFGVVIVSLILISSVVMVSAGFLDIFKFGDEGEDLEGELDATFDASVGLANAPPIIVAVYDVIDNEGGSTTDNDINPVAEDINNAQVDFLARDPNSNDDLPGGSASILQATAVGDLGTGGVNIEVYFTSPSYSTKEVADAASCVRLPTCPNSQGGGGCPGNDMEYRCTIPLQYYYEPGTNTWQLYVGVADVGAGTGENIVKTFTYTQLPSFKISNVAFTGLQWAGVDLGLTNQLPTNDPVELMNIGNVNYVSGTVTGYDLPPGEEEGGDDLPVSAFSMGTQTTGNAECVDGVTADALVDSIAEGIISGGAPSLIYGDSAGGAPITIGEEVHFCLWQQLDTTGLSFTETTYGTTKTGGTAWDLVLSVS